MVDVMAGAMRDPGRNAGEDKDGKREASVVSVKIEFASRTGKGGIEK
jgi:hypothetical protein